MKKLTILLSIITFNYVLASEQSILSGEPGQEISGEARIGRSPKWSSFIPERFAYERPPVRIQLAQNPAQNVDEVFTSNRFAHEGSPAVPILAQDPVSDATSSVGQAAQGVGSTVANLGATILP